MNAVVFDLGNVLIEWNPRLLLSEEFIVETDFFAWNTELDRGAGFAELVARMRPQWPHFGDEFDRFEQRWTETLGNVLVDSIAVVDELRDRGVPVYVLSNSSAETLPRSPVVQDIFKKFDGVVLSGSVGLVKPDAAIFQHTADLYGLKPATTWFVDDSEVNVAAANALGWNGVHFTPETDLNQVLTEARVL